MHDRSDARSLRAAPTVSTCSPATTRMDGERAVLRANRDVCWYDWPTQLRSVARLRDLSFCWVLPGHGDRVRLDPADMRMTLDDIAGVAISGKTAPSKSGAGVSSP